MWMSVVESMEGFFLSFLEKFVNIRNAMMTFQIYHHKTLWREGPGVTGAPRL